ncbi:MAG TPA: hypothetical protein DIW80_02920 [Gordonia polyisoprenivorans]|uniref:hypothetical protein n=1 Tax=Gordonia polyisoprenivorans TaxID=84595 RepID=UPI000EBBEAFC|nr:hypothetical protein [Gordonia polyisoprenivorans]HCS56357.1 hypothetical protein [Gordonia polyisoprenivorans]
MQLSPDYHRYFNAYTNTKTGDRQSTIADAAVIALVGKSSHETGGGELPLHDDNTSPVGIDDWAVRKEEDGTWITTVVTAHGLAQITDNEETISGVFAPWASVTGIEITSMRKRFQTTDPNPVWRPVYRINTQNGPIELGEGDRHERVAEIVRSHL